MNPVYTNFEMPGDTGAPINTPGFDANLVQRLLQTVSEQSEQIKSLTSRALGESHGYPRAPKFADVAPFDGKSKDYHHFLTQIELFFLNTPSFSSDIQKISYVLSRLSGLARDWGTNLLQRKDLPANALTLSSWEEFLNSFKRFKDPSLEETNATDLLHLRQRSKESVNSYATRFYTLMNNSVYATFPETAKPIFYNGLKPELKKILVEKNWMRELPLEALIMRVTDLDARLYSFEVKESTAFVHKEVHRPFSKSGVVPMEVDVMEVSLNGIVYSNAPERIDELRAMDREDCRKVCLEEARCFYCKKVVGRPPSHRAANCPVKARNTASRTYLLSSNEQSCPSGDEVPLQSSNAPPVSVLHLSFGPHSGLGTLRGTIQGVSVVNILVDSGAEGEVFISEEFAIRNNLEVIPLDVPTSISAVDGAPIGSGMILGRICNLALRLGDNYVNAEVSAFVIQMKKFPAILGIKWLRKVNPKIDWNTGLMEIPAANSVSISVIESSKIESLLANDQGLLRVILLH